MGEQGKLVQPKLLILSAGRSGSGYIAKVLSELGVDTGHEVFYNPGYWKGWRAPDVPVVESSWLGLPAVESGAFKGAVVHQYRDPLRVLDSFMNGEMFTEWAGSYLDFRLTRTHAHTWRDWKPSMEVLTESARIHAMMDTLADWLYRCEAVAEFSYSVEGMDWYALTELLEMIDEPRRDFDTIQDVLRRLPRTINKHADGPGLAWEDLPDRPSKVMLQAWAAMKRYRS